MNIFKTSTSYCPYCKEKIKADAVKCKHCGEWLNLQSINKTEKIEKAIIVENNKKEVSNDDINQSNITKQELSNIEISENNSKSEANKNSQDSNTVNCIFCGKSYEIDDEYLIEGNYFECYSCGRKTFIYENENDRVDKSIPFGFGWIVTSVLFMLNLLQFSSSYSKFSLILIPFFAILYVYIYFYFRRKILLYKYKKKKKFGKLYTPAFYSFIISSLIVGGLAKFFMLLFFKYILNI